MRRIRQQQPPHGEHHSVVIIGAGMAGLAAAHTMLDNGISPLVLEAESQPGGRCVTVAHDGGVFDLGAQFFTVRDAAFRQFLENRLDAGQAREWTRGFPDISGVSELASHPRYCGVAGMGALAASLARDIQIRFNSRVKGIVEGRACWFLTVDNSERIKADMVLMTSPLPSALRLISDENTWRMGALLLPLTGVSYAPRLAVAAILDGPSGLPAPGAARVDDGAVSWIADNKIKGISPDAFAVTIHATRAFAENHGDMPADAAGNLLAEAAAAFLESGITSALSRRWEHGAPESILQRDYYLVEGRAPLYFAGDAFSRGQIEGAVLSGIAAANAITTRLSATSATAE